MKRHLKDKCKDSPSKKQYFVAETQEPPGSPIFKGGKLEAPPSQSIIIIQLWGHKVSTGTLILFYHQLDNINIIKQWKKNKEYSNNWYENNDVLKSNGHQRFNGCQCPRTPANSKSLYLVYYHLL